MWYYLPIVFLPSLLVVVCGKFFFPHHITVREWGLQLLGCVFGTLLCLGLVMASSAARSGDFAIFSGYVTDKAKVKVSCEHQYKCGERCYPVSTTDSKGKVSTRTQCDPIYCDEHDYDIDWDVYTTLGTWTIDREDRRGLKMPPRWELVEKEDPVAESRYVQNFMLLDNKRFETDKTIHEMFKDVLLPYPQPFDYYNIRRIVQDDKQDWDDISIWLNNQLKKDGLAKQLNVILVVTHQPADYYYAQMEAWQGARKNDVILFYGIDDENAIQWSRATSFAEGQGNQIMLKTLESMTLEKTFGVQVVQEQYKLIVKDFQRIPNKTFEYLKEAWVPPTWWVLTMAFINLACAIGVAVFVIKEDVV